jgi:hypothetical protein
VNLEEKKRELEESIRHSHTAMVASHLLDLYDELGVGMFESLVEELCIGKVSAYRIMTRYAAREPRTWFKRMWANWQSR